MAKSSFNRDRKLHIERTRILIHTSQKRFRKTSPIDKVRPSDD